MAFLRFEGLRVFQLAEQLADGIWEIVATWRYFEKDTVGKQMVRAADSIGANIAEGSGRGLPNDNKRFVRIARGSLNEARYWLRRALKRGLIEHAEIETISKLMDELAPSLNAHLTSIGRNA